MKNEEKRELSEEEQAELDAIVNETEEEDIDLDESSDMDDEEDMDDEDEDEEDMEEEDASSDKEKLKEEMVSDLLETFLVTKDRFVSEDVITGLTEDVDMDDETKNKTLSIFRAAVIEEANSAIREMAEKVSEYTLESIEDSQKSIKEEYNTHLDSYLHHVANDWLKENEIAVETGLKVEMAEKLFGGIKSVMEDVNMEVDTLDVDLVNEQRKEIEGLLEELNEAKKEVYSLRESDTKVKREEIIDSVCEGAADSIKDRISSICENIEYDEKFEERVNYLLDNMMVVESAEQDDTPLAEEKKNDVPAKKSFKLLDMSNTRLK